MRTAPWGHPYPFASSSVPKDGPQPAWPWPPPQPPAPTAWGCSLQPRAALRAVGRGSRVSVRARRVPGVQRQPPCTPAGIDAWQRGESISIIKLCTAGLRPSRPAPPSRRGSGDPQGSTHLGPYDNKRHPGPPCSHGKASVQRISWWKKKEAGAGGCFPPGWAFAVRLMLRAPGEREEKNVGGQTGLPHWGGGLHPDRSRFMPQAHTRPNKAERCLYPPFPKGKKKKKPTTFWGSYAAFLHGEPRLSLAPMLPPPPVLTPPRPSPVQSPSHFLASEPPRLSPTLSLSSPAPQEGNEHLPDHDQDIPEKTNWASIPPCPSCLGGERQLLTKTKAPFAQKHQPFGSPAPPPHSLTPPGGESQPTSNSLGEQGACQKEHRAFSTGM